MGKAPAKKDRTFQGKKKPARVFVSREQAMKIMQASLSQFRQLCIMKGIHPKEPTSKKGYVKGRTYYLRKDIRFLEADPLLDSMRKFYTFLKKCAKLQELGHETQHEHLIKTQKPIFNFDHLVKERYPSFPAALQDLDDCLSTVFLFSKMGAEHNIEPALIQKCKELADEFSTYLAETHSLRKVFCSYKGIYYQAEIQGEKISWVTPYDFPHDIPNDVDFNVFHTFLTFYTTMLGFINHKLFNSLGIKYPLETISRQEGPSSYILKLKKLDSETSTLSLEQSKQDKAVAFESAPKLEKQENTENRDIKELMLEKLKNLFSGLVFFLSREVPRSSLEFVITCFGGKVHWDGPDSEIKSFNHPAVTHLITDRQKITEEMEKVNSSAAPGVQTTIQHTVEIVQPQWVFDSINSKILLPTDAYKQGKTLPPHLSPFVEYDESTYKPKYAEEVEKLVKREMNMLANALDDGLDDEDDDKKKVQEEDDEVEEEELYVKEKVAEEKGLSYPEFEKQMEEEKKKKDLEEALNPALKKKTKQELKEEEERNLRASMLSSKKKRLYSSAKSQADHKKNELSRLRARFVKEDLKEKEKAQKKVDVEEDEEAEEVEEMEPPKKISKKEVNKMEEDEDDDDEYAALEALGKADDDDDEVLVEEDDDESKMEEEEEEKPQPKQQPKQQPKKEQPKKEQPKKQQSKKQAKKQQKQNAPNKKRK